jgi:ribonucleotide monophosphatase NagD (HAD superfamily)
VAVRVLEGAAVQFVGFHARPPASSAFVTSWSTSSRLSHDRVLSTSTVPAGAISPSMKPWKRALHRHHVQVLGDDDARRTVVGAGMPLTTESRKTFTEVSEPTRLAYKARLARAVIAQAKAGAIDGMLANSAPLTWEAIRGIS